ncbi:MAG TPA: NlpC/P60 family protein [Streptosporangiaceae bacterium]
MTGSHRGRAHWRGAHWQRAALVAGTVAVCAGILPASTALAAPSSGTPDIKATLAEANKLSAEIDLLSEQYDGLKIQLAQAKAEATLAKENAARDEKLLAEDQKSIGAIAVEGYMTGGISPTIELLQNASPQSLLDRASIMTQLEQENGAKVNLVANANAAAKRSQAAALQEQQRAKTLASQMQAKVAQIQKKEDFFNSQAFQQAEAIFQKTGSYPDINVSGDSIGVQALRLALTKRGDPYVWGAAGPSSFDCSGLVVWSYGQLGISLMHFTGDLWNEGEHVSRSELEPGDLVFFYADLGHVGIYLGDGMMVDAPTFGQDVQVQPVMWNVYEGAVRIVA